MRKQLAIAFILTFMAFSIQSFRLLPATKPLPAFKTVLKPGINLQKKFTTRNLYKLATSSGSVSLQIEFQVEFQVGTIYSIRIFDNSSCQEYGYVGYTGSITYSGGQYQAVSLDIDLDGSGTHVAISGQIPIGFAPCNGI